MCCELRHSPTALTVGIEVLKRLKLNKKIDLFTIGFDRVRWVLPYWLNTKLYKSDRKNSYPIFSRDTSAVVWGFSTKRRGKWGRVLLNRTQGNCVFLGLFSPDNLQARRKLFERRVCSRWILGRFTSRARTRWEAPLQEFMIGVPRARNHMVSEYPFKIVYKHWNEKYSRLGQQLLPFNVGGSFYSQ